MIFVLFRNEVRMILRDKRSVVISIILPILVMPLMLFASFSMQKKREAKILDQTYQYAITGEEPAVASNLLHAAILLLDAEAQTNASQRLKIKSVSIANPWLALTNGTLHFVLEGSSKSPTNLNLRAPATHHISLGFRADRDDASAAAYRLINAFSRAKTIRQEELLREKGLGIRFQDAAAVSTRNVADPGHVAGLSLGRMITLLLMFFMLMAGAMVASDLVAGEKERGTLETLLTSAASRVEIVMAKHMVIMAVALTITCIQALNLLVYVGLRIVPVPAHFAQAAPPHVALLLLLLFIPVTGIVSSVLLLTSGMAKSYKEAQMYFTPVLLVGLIPAVVPMLPGLSLRSAIVLVPIANIALAAKEILIGIYDWPMLILAWCVTAGTALALINLTVRALSSERLITAADSDPIIAAGGLPLLQTRVWRWFAVMWALLLIAGNYMQSWDIRAQLFVNLVVIFLGASLLIIWKYKLPTREVFSLRLPRPIVWPAIIAAAPCGVLAGTGLFMLLDKVIPVPPEIVESFSSQVAPASMSPLQIVFFLAVLPGVVEELTFRGVLLHALHKRMRPWALALVVGLVFGIFHVALFRLAPTALLGILLAAVTLLTGSIFPAMLWHALSNSLALLAGLNGYPVSDLAPEWFAVGALGLIAVFIILWRNRTPYPGLRFARAP